MKNSSEEFLLGQASEGVGVYSRIGPLVPRSGIFRKGSKEFSFPLFSRSPEIKGSSPGPCSGGCCCGEDVATGFLCLLFDLALSGGFFHVAHAGG